MELLTLVYSYTDTETIQAIMMEVPGMWASIINPQYQKMLREFQNIIQYHEESLKKLEAPILQPPCLPNWEYTSACFPYCSANINLVRWSKNIGTPSFPKDDSNVSPRKTPNSMGTRPCRHCGSRKHWDNECQHLRKGEKFARVNCIQLKDNDLKAQEDYNNLFYELESDSEEGGDQQDFCKPLQHSDLPNQPSKPNSESLEEMSSPEGTEGINLPLGAEDSNLLGTNSFKVDLTLEPSFSSRDLSMTPKIPLNWNTQRHLA